MIWYKQTNRIKQINWQYSFQQSYHQNDCSRNIHVAVVLLKGVCLSLRQQAKQSAHDTDEIMWQVYSWSRQTLCCTTGIHNKVKFDRIKMSRRRIEQTNKQIIEPLKQNENKTNGTNQTRIQRLWTNTETNTSREIWENDKIYNNNAFFMQLFSLRWTGHCCGSVGQVLNVSGIDSVAARTPEVMSSLPVTLQVVLMGQLFPGEAISHFSECAQNKLMLLCFLVRLKKKTSKEKKSQGDHSRVASLKDREKCLEDHSWTA